MIAGTDKLDPFQICVKAKEEKRRKVQLEIMDDVVELNSDNEDIFFDILNNMLETVENRGGSFCSNIFILC